jgi:hypothetical protein
MDQRAHVPMRVAIIRGPGRSSRLNGTHYLMTNDPTNEDEVYDDNAIDSLIGGSGRDWFFALLNSADPDRDTITNLANNETVDLLS